MFQTMLQFWIPHNLVTLLFVHLKQGRGLLEQLFLNHSLHGCAQSSSYPLVCLISTCFSSCFCASSLVASWSHDSTDCCSVWGRVTDTNEWSFLCLLQTKIQKGPKSSPALDQASPSYFSACFPCWLSCLSVHLLLPLRLESLALGQVLPKLCCCLKSFLLSPGLLVAFCSSWLLSQPKRWACNKTKSWLRFVRGFSDEAREHTERCLRYKHTAGGEGGAVGTQAVE